jgi:hypothetical protein
MSDDDNVLGGDCESICDSITESSEAGQSFSSTSSRKRKSKSGSVFKAWHFQLMITADLRNGSEAVEKEKLLKEFLTTRSAHSRPRSVLGLVVFCNRSQLSAPHDSRGQVSIELLGYVQAKDATPHSTMTKWLDSATWTPVPGGLTSDHAYMSNVHRSADPHAEWARLLVFGGIGANNVGRAAEKNARQVGLSFAKKQPIQVPIAT